MKRLTIFLAFLCLLLIGCQSGGIVYTVQSSFIKAFTMPGKAVWLQQIEFEVTPDMNDNSPVSLHLLIVSDDTAWRMLLQMDSKKYFQMQESFFQRFADVVDRQIWNFIPGYHPMPATFPPSSKKAVGIVMFANYNSPGSHRTVLTDEKIILVTLGQKKYDVIRIT